LKGKSVRLKPEYDGDWLDLGILHRINELIADTGHRFERRSSWTRWRS